MKVLKQNIGIDIAKDSFVASIIILLENLETLSKGTKKFSNNSDGFKAFWQWAVKHTNESITTHYTMEATGVYYESLAYFLNDKQQIIHVILPNQAKKYIESFNTKSKTDKIDATLLGKMGVERNLKQWTLSSSIYRKLRTLTREKAQFRKESTRIKNQLHAEMHTAEPVKETIARIKRHTKYLEKLILSVEKDLKKITDNDEFLKGKIEDVTTIPGVGYATAVIIIAETGGFDNFTSLRQLTSYAGLDVRIQESGKWAGKSSISKKGNSHIRHALYLPSYSTIKHTNTYGKFYKRLNEKKKNGLISGVAVQRKILCLIYTLWKNDTQYIDDYQVQNPE